MLENEFINDAGFVHRDNKSSGLFGIPQRFYKHIDHFMMKCPREERLPIAPSALANENTGPRVRRQNPAHRVPPIGWNGRSHGTSSPDKSIN
ncbi:MAG TPA: hypothetical protein VGR14_16290 [Verrucomicrobiae bacterium]|nr:hypothetical protein [Verrucomicrobiae bacterium]